MDSLPADSNSDAYISSIGPETGLHPDFGSVWNGSPIGIPYTVVPGTQPEVSVTFVESSDQSDPGPYPIPMDAFIEGGSDSNGGRHVLVIDRDNCVLYELYKAFSNPDGTWKAGSGAVFNLNSNALRPEEWTSADAAGLPILPGLVRYDEVVAGEIRHALRFTVQNTRNEYIWPARHQASKLTDSKYPPMGQRFRLRADYDISGFSREVRVILTALKRYGMILADNGSNWYVSGVPDERWNNDTLVPELKRVHGSDFEAVDESSLMVSSDSGQAGSSAGPVQWKTDNGGNGHWYDAVYYSSTWDEANTHAASQYWKNVQGHLATVTSEAENSFIWNNFPYDGYRLGGYQTEITSDAAENWAWVTGEPWIYENWNDGEPNDAGGIGSEEHLTFWSDGKWNDNYDGAFDGYIIEYDAVVTEGIVSGHLTTSFAGHDSLSVINAVISLEGTKNYTPATYNDGTFSFRDVEPGTYTLVINAPNLRPHSQQITLTSGENKTASIPPMSILYDVNGDGREGLQEAVHALQVSAGLKP